MNIEKGIDKIVKTIRLLIMDQPGFLGRVVPSILNHDMHKAVAQAVERAAFETGMARACNPDLAEG